MSDWNTKGLKVGDTVQVEGQRTWAGRMIPAGEYEIIELESDGYNGCYHVRLDGGEWGDIAKMTKVTGFDDIKVGDKIRVTKDYNGETIVRTGVVKIANDRYVETNAFSIYRSDADQTFEVLERAMDPLPTQEGSLILATVNGNPNTPLWRGGYGWYTLAHGSATPESSITEWVPAKVVAQD